MMDQTAQNVQSDPSLLLTNAIQFNFSCHGSISLFALPLFVINQAAGDVPLQFNR